MLTKQALHDAIFIVLEDGANLVWLEQYPQNEPTLRVNVHCDEWHVTLGGRPGNAYQIPKDEIFYPIGIPCDSLDYGDIDPDNETEYEKEVSADAIVNNGDDWVDEIWWEWEEKQSTDN